MRTNWPLVAGIVAVLSVPFALAVLEDTASEEPDEPAEDGERAALEAAAPPAEPPPRARDEPGADWRDIRAMGLDFFDEVFFAGEGASAPALAGPLAGAAFGMSREELLGAVPRFMKWVAEGSPRYPELHAALLYQTPAEGLSRVSLSFPDDGTARRVFASRWGAPLERRGSPRASRLWLNPDLGVRLALHEGEGRARTELQPYVPLEAFIAPGEPKTFGFERIPLLGASREEVARAYPDELLSPGPEEASALTLVLPASTYAHGPTRVALELEEERVHELRFPLDCSYADACEEAILPLFERKLGSYRRVGGGRLELTGAGREVTVELSGGAAQVRVAPR